MTGAATVEQPDRAGIDAVTLRVDRRLPVSDQVYDALRGAIVSIRLLPGTAISENTIGRHFSVSRTPVRAAIQRLADEGLIDVFPQQGSFVAPVRLADIRDSHFVRRSLELAIVREAGRLWSTEKSLRARAAIALHRATLATGDDDAFHREDERFHQLLTVLAEREGVWTAIVSARSRLSRFMRIFGHAERLPMVVAEHEAVIDALDAGDVARAEVALADHLDKIFTLLDQLPAEYRQFVED